VNLTKRKMPGSQLIPDMERSDKAKRNPELAIYMQVFIRTKAYYQKTSQTLLRVDFSQESGLV